MKLTIIDASWHRNGISGVGFYAVIFDCKEDGEARRMVASLFDEDGYCAVYSIPELVKGNIQFAQGNSWRGDNYESELRPLLKQFFEKNSSGRIGPFSFPLSERTS